MAEMEFNEFINLDAIMRSAIGGNIFVDEYRKAFKKHGRYYVSTMIRERLSGRPGLKRRTGDLARSTNSITVGNDLRNLTMIATIGRAKRYAAIHEFSGVIRPKRAKFLTVPLDSVRTASGVPRFKASEIDDTFTISLRGKLFIARSFKSLTVARSILRRAKNLLTLGPPRKNGRITVLLFKLVPSVKIPARLGARDTFIRKDVSDNRKILIEKATKRAWKRAGFKN
jgi:phage gpG-like protein